MTRSAYETLYKRLMNINEDGCQPWGMALALMVIGVCEIPPTTFIEAWEIFEIIKFPLYEQI